MANHDFGLLRHASFLSRDKNEIGVRALLSADYTSFTTTDHDHLN
jgi:hypothetical protein